MTRIADAFARAAAEDRPALVAYVMAGEPDAKRDEEYARAVLAQADVLEVGVPFSDPVADGPTIERAHTRSLAAGTTLSRAFALASALRAGSGKPILLMLYYNPALQRGLDGFARAARDAGVDGVIVPDLPLEESAPLGAALEKAGLALVQLASPATPPERMARLAKATRGFLYVVSSFGVTGARADLAPETRDVIARARAACAGGGVPFAVGFGVATPEHVRAMREAGAEGVVVGSAIVGRIEKGETPEQVAGFVRGLGGR